MRVRGACWHRSASRQSRLFQPVRGRLRLACIRPSRYANGRTLARRLGHKIYGATDAIGVHVGLQGLVDLHGFDDVGGNGIQLDLADAGFREGVLMPSIVTLARRGSVPRICTYLPSPSSRSMVTLGKRRGHRPNWRSASCESRPLEEPGQCCRRSARG